MLNLLRVFHEQETFWAVLITFHCDTLRCWITHEFLQYKCPSVIRELKFKHYVGWMYFILFTSIWININLFTINNSFIRKIRNIINKSTKLFLKVDRPEQEMEAMNKDPAKNVEVSSRVFHCTTNCQFLPRKSDR